MGKEHPIKRPKMKLAGQDGNIFAIWGRAEKLLRENGQGRQAEEMANRISNAASYGEALGIISEYVETELTATRPNHSRRLAEKGDTR